jgi:hypothetical protein
LPIKIIFALVLSTNKPQLTMKVIVLCALLPCGGRETEFSKSTWTIGLYWHIN